MASSSNVVGGTPISIPSSTGGQRVVPLCALEFNDSTLQVRSAWATAFDAAEAAALLGVAKGRMAIGELTKPAAVPPMPALVVTARTPGRESDGIVVHATPADGSGPDTAIAMAVQQTWTYTGLTTAAAAAAAIGTPDAPAAQGDPPQGTGPAVVKADFNATATDLPDAFTDTAVPAAGLAVKSGSKKLFTLLPAAAVTQPDCLSAAVEVASGSFSVSVAYDSAKAGEAPTVTLQTLDSLTPAVDDLIGLSTPPGGAAVPAKTPTAGVPLTGGGTGRAAGTLLYTPAVS